MPDFIIATNGTILDDEIIAYSIKYNWRVGLSFDGPEMIHDIVRRFRNGETTVSVIKDNIKNGSRQPAANAQALSMGVIRESISSMK